MSRKVLVVDDEKLIVKESVLIWSRTEWKWIVLTMEKRP